MFLVHVAEARRLLHALVGKWGDEFGYRRIPRGPVKRIEDPAARACCLCPADAWLPETMSHLLLRCPHAAMVRLPLNTIVAAPGAGKTFILGAF